MKNLLVIAILGIAWVNLVSMGVFAETEIVNLPINNDVVPIEAEDIEIGSPDIGLDTDAANLAAQPEGENRNTIRSEENWDIQFWGNVSSIGGFFWTMLVAIFGGIVWIITRKPCRMFIWKVLKFLHIAGKNERKRAEYNEVVRSYKFENWQYTVLKNLYCQSDIQGEYGEGNVCCEVFKHHFLVVCHEATEKANTLYTTDTTDTTECDLTQHLDLGNPEKHTETLKIARRYERGFKQVSGNWATRPKSYGFMLKSLIIEDKKMTGFTAYPGTYWENVLSTYVLNYELFLKYKNRFTRGKLEKAKKPEEILGCLPLRKKIHEGIDRKQWFRSGANRFSLLGVQALIIYRDFNKNYHILLGLRSDKMVYPYCLQFPPSGGFEVYESEGRKGDVNIKGQFLPQLALYRELLEEVFNEKNAVAVETEENKGKRDGKSYIENHTIIRNFKELLKPEDPTEIPKASFEFLGAVTDMASLKTELCFLIHIYDDGTFMRLSTEKGLCEEEFEEAHEIKIEELDDFVEKYTPPGSSHLASVRQDNMFVPTSAALYYLVKKSDTYKKIMAEIAGQVGQS